VPDGIVCDSVEVESLLLQSLLPSLDELTMLAHARQADGDDKELHARSGDGLYAVLMSNRIPAPNARFRACLVSLEERTDLVQADPPPVASPIFIGILENPVLGNIDNVPKAKNPAQAAAESPAPKVDFGGRGGSTIL